ncbi:hypothetical protein [Gorillibacterium sp. sgz5001074]
MEDIRNSGEGAEAENEAGLTEDLTGEPDEGDAEEEDVVHIEWAGFI